MIVFKLKEIAESKGLDREQLATASGVIPKTIDNLWCNRVVRIDMRTLERLCSALETDPGDLLVREHTRETNDVHAQSVLDFLQAHHRFLEEHPEHQLFASAAEVDEYIKQERDSWDTR